MKIDKYFIVGFFILIGIKTYGQISTNELPVSFTLENRKEVFKEIEVKMLPSIDMNKINKEDEEDVLNGIPPRFGYLHKVNYNLDNAGTWTILPNKDKIWQLKISCPGALSINLLYDEFYLPEGGKLFIYSEDQKHTIGAFTSNNNKGNRDKHEGFATGLIFSDIVTLEYYLPVTVQDKSAISVAYVVQGYRYINLPDQKDTKYFGGSGGCEVNINCPEGSNWQKEKNAVALILVNGNRYCTGSLVNTTANDARPVFLTADHCLGGWANDIKYDAITDPLLNHWSFYWNYESPNCTNSSEPPIKSTVGATILANNSISDFALLSLSEDPKDDSGISTYYLGWDRTEDSSAGGVGIHHPSGDVKKISTYTMSPQSTDYLDYTTISTATYWRVAWVATTTNHGVTEGGSSGSSLINNNRRVIGQLHGGYSSCSNLTESDWYGKLSTSWTGNDNSDNRRRLRDWLDPINLNPQYIDGSEVCLTYNFTYQTVTTNTTVTGCKVLAENISVSNGANLSINAEQETYINGNFEIQSGSSLEIQ